VADDGSRWCHSAAAAVAVLNGLFYSLKVISDTHISLFLYSLDVIISLFD